MNIEITKRNSNPLDISINSKGDKLIYITKPPKELPTIETTAKTNSHKDMKNQSSNNVGKQVQYNSNNMQISQDKDKQDNIKSQFHYSVNQYKQPEQQNNFKQPITPSKTYIQKKHKSVKQKFKNENEQMIQKYNSNQTKNDFKQTLTEKKVQEQNNQKSKDENNQDDLNDEDLMFLRKYQQEYIEEQKYKELKTNNNEANKDFESKADQRQYIKNVQELIDNINSFTSTKFTLEIKNQIDQLGKMLKKIISFEDSLLVESKILISYINLFMNDLLTSSSKFNNLYSIFFNDNIFIIGPNLYFYFNTNSNQVEITLIVSFIEKLFDAQIDHRNEILNFFKEILASDKLNLSKETNKLINQEIEKLENDIILNTDKNHFIFSKETMNPKLNISELTNNYKKPWKSIDSYIKVMNNLTCENFFFALREHLEKLRNDELDPRDLNLYENVKIIPCYTYNDRSEYDLFVHFQIRSPNYKEGNEIKKHPIRTIDWQYTERLSNRKLLFFSLSPTMETIEAVAISQAKKGTIQNNTIPILFIQGTLEIEKEYYMFEPIDHWNGPLFNNLLNTNEMTLPKSLIKPIISLDFSDNFIDKDDALFHISDLFKDKENNLISDYKIESTDEDIQYYCQQIISTLKRPTTNKKVFLRSLMNNLCHYLKNLEFERGNEKQFDPNSDIVMKVSIEIKRMIGFKKLTEKWVFDDFNSEDFRKNCVLDHEQFKAMKYSLNHHITLVNGAPGTGKTYLACELFKFLVNSDYKLPILVVTYKNVSLDGFLTNIVSFLREKNINFIRVGGKPRTENQFILDNQFDRIIPSDINKIKSQIIYLTSILVLINDCLNQLKKKSFSDASKSLITEIDNSICIRRIMYDMFPFYSKDEELITTHLLDPISCVPQADSYFNCWISKEKYYNDIKTQKHKELFQKYDMIFNSFINYLKKDQTKENDETIYEIIHNHFDDDENFFFNYLKENKKRINSKDYSFLYDMLYNCHRYDPEVLNMHHDSNKLKNYIIPKNDLIPVKIQETMKQKFTSILSKDEKVESFKEFLNEIAPLLKRHINLLKERCSEKQKEFEKNEVRKLGKELSSKTLIAMTATRAAQYKECLNRANCGFMIIEEAGELTEPMAFSIIPKSIQQLIMIGDYRQLRPTVEHKLSFPPYNHNISLFEKEVIHAKSIKSENLFTLSIQRRMHDQISLLLKRVFYNNNLDDEKLNNDESTSKIAKPLGFPNHIQFWLHEFEEEKENIKMRSHINIKEAQVCAYLFLMMLCRGYKSSEITIVSLYKGQKRQIEKELSKLIDKYYDDENRTMYDAFDFENDWPDIEDPPRYLNELIELRQSLVGRYVKCLDDFQGEENEVIIVSLTRSEKPGFVKNTNRALVTLSRAKQMEFVIGNKNVFGPQNTNNPLWQKICAEAILIDENVMHFNGIAACSCTLHNDKCTKTIVLNKPGDFIQCRFNCCREKCDCFCSCGHKCNLNCHFHSEISGNPKLMKIFNRRYFCKERCNNFCKKGHQCDDMCGNCMHYGCPHCSHQCEERCSLCSKRCMLHCCHSGKCQCQITGSCAKCHCKIVELHGKLKYLNGNDLVCQNCYMKSLKILKTALIDDDDDIDN